MSWIVANSIPFFHLMMGIVAACTTAPLTFGFPAYFYWHDTRRRARSCSKQQQERSVGRVGREHGVS